RAALADSATRAAVATNALSLGGVVAANYARRDVGNSFVGDQGIAGKLTAIGSTTDQNSAILHAVQNGSSSTDPTPGNYSVAAIRGDATTAGGRAFGVLGTAQTNDAAGVAGFNTAGIAVLGESVGPNLGAGVVGWCEQNAACIGVGSFLRTQGKLFEGRVAVDATDDEGITKFFVDSSGNVRANAYLDLAGNPIPASLATDLNCVGCVSPSEVTFNYAGSASQGGPAASALVANTATTATTANNALALGGVAAANYPQLGLANSFTASQSIAGDLALTGTGNLALNGKINGMLTLVPSVTDSSSGTTYVSANLIGGYSNNAITSGVTGATIGGGGGTYGGAPYPNTITDDWGTVSGGQSNRAGDNDGVLYNRLYATVGGGADNTASGARSTVAGGVSNAASGESASVGGGWGNIADGDWATIAGGKDNHAPGLYSFVAGGQNNYAWSGWTFAGGCNANAFYQGSFLWADSTCGTLNGSGNNQFIVRASGGVWFYSDDTSLHGVNLPAGSGAWSTLSDRNTKRGFEDVDGQTLLAQLNRIPMNRWSYKSQPPSIRHLGPMAQDFYAAFGLGEDDKHISTVDADGVALAAIQALYKLSLEKDRRIAELERRLDELQRQLEQRK
ncbi:MAG: hypothetical protein LAO07_15015, partial [Acidobacteriia bacterium]|nr:hypothetical protein [Terriglobia bacterium]